MEFPAPRRAPDEIFRGAVEHYPMPSMNVVLEHTRLGFLWVLRKNNPAKGEWWIPGGRMMNGETLAEAPHIVLKNETGLNAQLIGIAPHVCEEIFSTEQFTEEDWQRYNPSTRHVHYLSHVAYMKVESESPNVALDNQSHEHRWSKDMLSQHPYLLRYFDLIQDLRTQNHS